MRGYLWKKTKRGRWQRRWFEAQGCFLAYYRDEGGHLLAALNLQECGPIRFVSGGLFTIELNERIYSVRADDDASAQAWVAALREHQAKGGAAKAGAGAPQLQPQPVRASDAASLVRNAAPIAGAAGLGRTDDDTQTLRPAGARRTALGCPRCVVQ